MYFTPLHTRVEFDMNVMICVIEIVCVYVAMYSYFFVLLDFSCFSVVRAFDAVFSVWTQKEILLDCLYVIQVETCG